MRIGLALVLGMLMGLSAPAHANTDPSMSLLDIEKRVAEGRSWRNVMAPLAHVRHCMEYPEQCQRTKVSLRKRKVAMTPERMEQLRSVTKSVNQSIIPVSEGYAAVVDRWNLHPAAGDCDDYAVSKRATLISLGWPSSALLLTEITHSARENHLVLTVRTNKGDFVLDNLNNRVGSLRTYQARIERIQSPTDPQLWITTKPQRPLAVAGGPRHRIDRQVAMR
jgi:predicted transglutaminase-like cysteine proteinase